MTNEKTKDETKIESGECEDCQEDCFETCGISSFRKGDIIVEV